MTSPVPAAAATRAGELAASLAALRARVDAAAAAAGRDAGELTLVAVTKTWPASDAALLAGLGVQDLGESREQELRAKTIGLAPDHPGVRWHFLGRLQGNKARSVGALAGVVHSLDREALCAPLVRGAAQAGHPPPGVLVQVSLDGDPTRGGVLPAEAPTLAAAAVEAGLTVLGVMAVAPAGEPARQAFARLRDTAELLRDRHPGATWISAGMSGDLEDAVLEGATHLRVGTALFGGRRPSGH